MEVIHSNYYQQAQEIKNREAANVEDRRSASSPVSHMAIDSLTEGGRFALDIEDQTPLLKNSATLSTFWDRVSTASTKAILLCTLSVQTAGYVLLGRYTRSSFPPDQLYDIAHLVLMAELVKFVVSCFVEYVVTEGNLVESLRIYVWNRPLDALKPAIPALLYVLQNWLSYTALTHLSAPIYLAMSQGKLAATVFVSGILLQRSYKPQQWFCVIALSFGVALILKEESTDSSETTILGVLAVVGACFCSAFAGVYFEGVMKQSEGSLWLRNIQLSFYGVVTTAIQSSRIAKPFAHGFTGAVWMLVMMHAVGGLLVAAVLKYADNVLKGLALGVSVVMTSVLASVIFQVHLTNSFLVGASIILLSVYSFENPIAPCWRSRANRSISK